MCEPYVGLSIRNWINLTPFFRCNFYPAERLELLNSPYDIDLAIKEPNEDFAINHVLSGSDKYQQGTNDKQRNTS